MKEENTNNEVNINIEEKKSWFNKGVKEKMILVLLGSFMTLLTTIIVTWQKNVKEDNDWKKEKSYLIVKDIVDKRQEILERANAILSKSQLIKLYKIQIEAQQKVMNEYLKKDNVTSEILTTNIDQFVENQIEYNKLHSEASTVLSLAKYYFGPKSKKSINKISSKPADTILVYWFEQDPKVLRDVIDSMESELGYQVDFFNEK